MLFNSLEFFALFCAVLAAYYFLPHRPQNTLLLAASLVFYGAWDWRFLGLLLFTVAVDFVCARAIGRSTAMRTRKLFLAAALGSNLAVLAAFKYYDFFAAGFARLLSAAGLPAQPLLLSVILPLGISFYTFQSMSYTIDVYRREIAPMRRFDDFLLYISFFPQLVAGPIERGKHLIPQVAAPRTVTAAGVSDGLLLLLWGLFQKIFVADNLAPIADAIFAPKASYDGAMLLLGIYAFAIQVLADFSGYSDMARGMAKLLGFDLTLNFLSPYFSKNPREYWRRWHISVSSWFRDYLYVPLVRRGWTKTAAVMATMTLIGLWHGAKSTFVVWGAYQGALILAYAYVGRLLPAARTLQSRWLTPFKILLFFHLSILARIPFRAQSGRQAAEMTRDLFLNFRGDPDLLKITALQIAFYSSFFLCVQWAQHRTSDSLAAFRVGPPVRRMAIVAVAYMLLLFGNFGGRPYVYFQF